MMMCKNKQGFTLVELLAVIVILALIMGIAVFSISSILSNARSDTAKETANNYINATRKELIISNSFKEGYYFFRPEMMESGGIESPWGGQYNFVQITEGEQLIADNKYVVSKVSTNIYKYVSPYSVVTPTAALTVTPRCTSDSSSFIQVEFYDDNYHYKVCLASLEASVVVTGDEYDMQIIKDDDNV